jgi:hypothetical protein
VNWRMWMVVSAWVMAVLVLSYSIGLYTVGQDLLERFLGEQIDNIFDTIVLPLAAIVFIGSWLMDRMAARA